MAAVVLGATIMSTAPASAHDSRLNHVVFHGTSLNLCRVMDNCDFATVVNSHHTAVVRDMECDNHSVRAEYYRQGVTGMRTLHARGCNKDERWATDWAHPVTRLRVCEEAKGCSGWRST
ncbi:MAG TPA: hypothetical protein VK611_30500 [Acidimicrobiales bacterium]|nr:hypothetical protein [Acidimicrobiales bacterium]